MTQEKTAYEAGPRRCPHGCSPVAASAGHEARCPLGRTFPPHYETHDQQACPVCRSYFKSRGERA